VSDENGEDGRTGMVRPVLWIFNALSVVAGLMVAIMMFITTIDVISRYFFNRPLSIAFEITEILMGLLIFAGLPLATAARENITISVLTEMFPARVQSWQTRVFEFLCGAIAFVMAWRMWAYGDRLWNTGDRTLELHISIGLLSQIMAVMTALTGLAFIVNALRGRSLLPSLGASIE
jgi:TRAP-type C4-dicarboxylate transport system permease small subunit